MFFTSNLELPNDEPNPCVAADPFLFLRKPVSNSLSKSLKESSNPVVSTFLVAVGVAPTLLGEAGALKPGGRYSRFSCWAEADLKLEVRCELDVGTPFVLSSVELRRSAKGSFDSDWARELSRSSSNRGRVVEKSCFRGVFEKRDSIVGLAVMGRVNAGARNGSTLGCARSSISAVLRRSIVANQTVKTSSPCAQGFRWRNRICSN